MNAGFLKGGCLALLVLGLVGCSEDPQTAIIGSWAADSGAQDLHFYIDGTAQIDDHKLNREYDGQCVFEQGDTMRCSFDRLAFDIVRQVEVSGDELVLTSESGQPEYYHRIP